MSPTSPSSSRLGSVLALDVEFIEGLRVGNTDCQILVGGALLNAEGLFVIATIRVASGVRYFPEVDVLVVFEARAVTTSLTVTVEGCE